MNQTNTINYFVVGSTSKSHDLCGIIIKSPLRETPPAEIRFGSDKIHVLADHSLPWFAADGASLSLLARRRAESQYLTHHGWAGKCLEEVRDTHREVDNTRQCFCKNSLTHTSEIIDPCVVLQEVRDTSLPTHQEVCKWSTRKGRQHLPILFFLQE